ncbi:MAG TPA: RcnB family protein [Acidobacteriaceae bacterium]|nr:RcnB family protein [Acidobacteriaceae bacterium]
MLSISLTAVPLVAQGHDDHRDDSHHDNGYHDDHHQTYVRHKEWHKGYHMQRQDWDRGERIQDWRAYHLRQPPRGYEWREVDGNYVMAAVATGVIASVIAASAAH